MWSVGLLKFKKKKFLLFFMKFLPVIICEQGVNDKFENNDVDALIEINADDEIKESITSDKPRLTLCVMTMSRLRSLKRLVKSLQEAE
jgi:hypothetical protein